MILALALLAPDASACGGFACNRSQPVLQAAERIVFGVDETSDEVEMHVQITYAGPSEEFAWIVPVPQVPDLFLTTSSLFTQVAFATLPTFTLRQVDEGTCREGNSVLRAQNEAFAGAMSDAASTDWDSSSAPWDVTVVAEETVGAYETVTLRADSTEDLLGWLQDNDYDIPDTMERVLRPYVSEDAYFVALKLRKGSDAGDLAPLAMRFPGTRATVPVQLTSISATPDMRMEAYVLSRGRGVPESYLHVQVNDAAINWWTGGRNYDEVITQAANEAGGHAFATDFHGSTDVVPTLFVEEAWEEGALRAATGPTDWVESLRSMLAVTPTELFPVLEDAIGLAPGDGLSYWACPDCFTPGTMWGASFDPGLATDLLVERVIDPLRAGQDLLDRHPFLTRMTSSLDASEMTVDPVFVVNHDVAGDNVSNVHRADFVYECRNGKRRDKADRRLDLQDGRSIGIPSEKWFEKHGGTPFSYIRELGDQKAQVIEQYGDKGDASVVADFTNDFLDAVDLHNRQLGCSTTDAAGGLGLAAVGLLGLRRRRS